LDVPFESVVALNQFWRPLENVTRAFTRAPLTTPFSSSTVTVIVKVPPLLRVLSLRVRVNFSESLSFDRIACEDACTLDIEDSTRKTAIAASRNARVK
jgi:hypothetical protein